MSFDEKGNFVRPPDKRMEIIREKARTDRAKKCTEYILRRLFREPTENSVLWKELEPYHEVAKPILDSMLTWGVIRPKWVRQWSGKTKVIHHLNIYHEFLTDPKSGYYISEIAEASQAALDEARKHHAAHNL